MKRIPPLIVTAVVPALACMLVAGLAVLPARATATAETSAKIVSVDYILALMDAGIDQMEIVRRIEEKNLAFRIVPGDIDRLREAGAGKELIDVVTGEGVVLENKGAVPSAPETRPQGQGEPDTSQWQRPSRLDTDEGETNGEGIEELPDTGYYAAPSYGYYAPGYSSFLFSYGYPYPYYYSYPYYYYGPYGYHTYYSSPYYHYPHYSYRTAPRGGSFRGAPRGGSSRPAPHGGGGHRSSPRGSHH